MYHTCTRKIALEQELRVTVSSIGVDAKTRSVVSRRRGSCLNPPGRQRQAVTIRHGREGEGKGENLARPQAYSRGKGGEDRVCSLAMSVLHRAAARRHAASVCVAHRGVFTSSSRSLPHRR